MKGCGERWPLAAAIVPSATVIDVEMKVAKDARPAISSLSLI
jgi:hypothetical protein